MKKQVKKWISLMLVLSMCLSLFQMPVLAEDVIVEEAGSEVVGVDNSVEVTGDVVENESEKEETCGEVSDESETVSGEGNNGSNELGTSADENSEAADTAGNADCGSDEIVIEEICEVESVPTLDSDAAEIYTATIIDINPLYEGLISEEDLVQPDPYAVAALSDEYLSESEASAAIRDAMEARQKTIPVYFVSEESDCNTLAKKLVYDAFVHTNVPTEGDYLRWHYGGYSASVSYSTADNIYYYSFTYTMTYYTTADQEAELSTAVNALKEEILSESSTEFEIVRAIYGYMCANITYDHDNLNNSSYKLKFSAYAAMMNNTAVCQGYASLFYRLALECGLDARLISGIGNGGGHGWNIVKIGDCYYNLDTTWDATWFQGNLGYNYFLRNDTNFVNHARDDEFSSEDFYDSYPMAEADYEICTEHVKWISREINYVDATCLSEGSYDLATYCINCGKIVDAISKKIPIAGHTEVIDEAVAATCTEAGLTEGSHCSVCDVVFVAQEEVPALGHTEVADEAVAATCTEAGLSAGSHCSVCSTVLVAQEEVPALGHTEVADEAVAATCTEKGLTAGSHCSVCNTVLVAQEEVPVIDHTAGEITIENEKNASCETGGSYDQVVYCTVCGNEISRDTVEVEAGAHSYGAWVVSKEASCCENGEKTKTCLLCGAIETETIPITDHTPGTAEIENKVAATCTEPGSYEEVTKCTVCGEELTRTKVTEEATGHTPGSTVIENKVAATCTEPGSYEEVTTCTVCGEELTRTKVTEEATGHTPGSVVIENKVAATCTEPGSYEEVIKCTVCDEELTRTKVTEEATGHTPGSVVIENKVAATCTEQGSYEEVTTCTVCGEELTRTKVTEEATGHTPGSVVIKNKVAATCTEQGSYEEVTECAACGEELTRTKVTEEATGHTYSSAWTIDKKETCLAAGQKSHHCTVPGCTATKDSTEISKLPGKIKLTMTTLPLQVKKTFDLKQIVTGTYAEDYIKKCTSDNTSIVTVSGTTITGKKAGTANVTITLASGVSAKVKVTVAKTVKTTSLKVNVSKNLTMKIGQKVTAKATVTPITSSQTVTYSSSNKKVATVSSRGMIQAKASGTAKIKVKSGSKMVTIKVTVAKVKISGVSKTASLTVGQTLQLKPVVTNALSKIGVTYKSSNKKVATVSASGKITAKKKGTATITVTAAKVSVKCKVTVK